MITDNQTSYGWLSIAIHWLSAVMIIGLFAVGFYMVGLGYYDQGYHTLPRWHVSFGLLLGFVMLLRLVWRLVNWGNPKPLPDHTRPVRFLSTAMKYSLYLLIFTMIVTGYLITTARGDPARMFDIVRIPATIQLSSSGVDLAGDIHEIVGWAIVILAALHAGAALLHHFVIRDKTLKRMLAPQKHD